ncbi:Cd(II)/Pb(II)-responsive transcriptional regulator [Shewanella saliphila]|uniref:MerR family transcriptional regulator n=1 Tax=Shewanella saliphila TaxID=2282698 RepID=A0ABQ2Q4X0_9GAMM|nr:Cd(II)/Pb(II)-responsive transcriptional regulator [Shewanella saliphila]MCL1101320.1 Cd(II)/Pb(II)-responsive transcriptional regulator [Shewanella saliphila]GGP50077.1 MerR family transcriptional regulator [Shewanella saliphila]
MKISELASIAQVSVKTIRYYEQIGLLSAPNRTNNGYRFYQAKDIETLTFIRRCRELNIALDDIKRLVDTQQDPKSSCALVDNIIAQQLARIQQTQRELALLEQSLAALASCCQNHQIKDCSILHTLKSS